MITAWMRNRVLVLCLLGPKTLLTVSLGGLLFASARAQADHMHPVSFPVASTPRSRSTESRSGESRLTAVSPITEQFRRRTEHAARTIPGHVWTALWQAGWRVRLAEFVVDAAPTLRGVQPRGWPDGLTWEHSDAAHLPSSRLLVFAEKRLNRAGAVVASFRVEGVLRHEIGHAFDVATSGSHPFYSANRDFLRAYLTDVSRIGARDRQLLSYYLQNRTAGAQETFAEAFAILLGGGSDPPNREHFIRCFPTVLQHVRQVIGTYHAPTPPSPNATVAAR